MVGRLGVAETNRENGTELIQFLCLTVLPSFVLFSVCHMHTFAHQLSYCVITYIDVVIFHDVYVQVIICIHHFFQPVHDS